MARPPFKAGKLEGNELFLPTLNLFIVAKTSSHDLFNLFSSRVTLHT